MNPKWTLIAVGVRRGGTLLKQDLATPSVVIGSLFPSLIAIIVLFFLRDLSLGAAAPVDLGGMALPSLIGMNIAFSGILGLMGSLLTERTDGTMLRAKAVPGGMTAYVVGLCINVSAFAAVSVIMIMIPGVIIFDGVAMDSLASWLTLTWVLVLGLFATMPVGTVFGSMIQNPRNMGLVMLPMMGLVGISGIFYPITALPGWVQIIGQVFPVYWLGLGMRSAMLPDAMAALEIGGTWRHLETVGVLGAWAAIGLFLAPVVLRRMARRESGSSVAARRARMMRDMP